MLPSPASSVLALRAWGGVGVGALSSLSLFASVPPPLAPPHSHPATQASRGPRLGEGNTPSLRLASRHMRWPCRSGEGLPRSEPLFEEPDQPWRHETGIAAAFVDRIAHPVVGGALHDAGAREEIRLLQPHQEGVGLRAAVDQVILGADAQEDADL